MGHGENMGTLDTKLTALANAIRTKTGVTGALSLDAMANAITNYKNSTTLDDVSFIQRTIKKIVISNGVTSIGSSAFSGCSSLTSVTIPSGVTSISSSAFYGCSSLTSVTIPNGVTSIGSSAFSGCSSLTSVTIPSGVTSIGPNAFRSCESLTSVTIPISVTSIDFNVFMNCNSLTDIYCGFAEGAVSGAPWGAYDEVTIHYNT